MGGGTTAVYPDQQHGHCMYPVGHPSLQQSQPVYYMPLNQPRGNEWRHDQPLGPQQQQGGQVFVNSGEGLRSQMDGGLHSFNQMDVERIVIQEAAAPPQVSAGVPQGGQVAREDDENGEVDDEEDENLLGDADRDATRHNSGNVWDEPSTPAQFLRQDDDDENT